MDDPISRIIDRIIKREGGYVDHPADRGGPTNFGITLKTLEGWRGEDLAPGDVQTLDVEEARLIYQCRFVEEPGFDRLPASPFVEQVIDAGVLHGTGRAATWLQMATGAHPDGIIGPRTRAAVAAASPHAAMIRFARLQLNFIATIIANDTEQVRHIRGWVDRATSHLLCDPTGDGS